jgi:hypothetical protein
MIRVEITFDGKLMEEWNYPILTPQLPLPAPRNLRIMPNELHPSGTPIEPLAPTPHHPTDGMRDSPHPTEGKRDSDLDGFFEWRSTVTRGVTADSFQTVNTYYAPTTGTPLRRETYARSGAVINVQIEEAAPSGAMRLVAQFDTGLEEPQVVTGVEGVFGHPNPLVRIGETSGQSSPSARCDHNFIEDQLLEAILQGSKCMETQGESDIALATEFHYIRREFTIQCTPNLMVRGRPVSAHIKGWENPTGPVVVTVNSDTFFGLAENQQRGLLFHEMLHLHFGPHDRTFADAPRERDRSGLCLPGYVFPPDDPVRMRTMPGNAKM